MDTSHVIKPKPYFEALPENSFFKVFPAEIIVHIFSFLNSKEKYSALLVNKQWNNLMAVAIQKECHSKIKKLSNCLKNRVSDLRPKREIFDLLQLYAFSSRAEKFSRKNIRSLKKLDIKSIVCTGALNKYSLFDIDISSLERISGIEMAQILRSVFVIGKIETDDSNATLLKMSETALKKDELDLAFVEVQAMEIAAPHVGNIHTQAANAVMRFDQTGLLMKIAKRWVEQFRFKEAAKVAFTISKKNPNAISKEVECLEGILQRAISFDFDFNLRTAVHIAEHIACIDGIGHVEKADVCWYVAKRLFLVKKDLKSAQELIFKIPDASTRSKYLEKLSKKIEYGRSHSIHRYNFL